MVTREIFLRTDWRKGHILQSPLQVKSIQTQMPKDISLPWMSLATPQPPQTSPLVSHGQTTIFFGWRLSIRDYKRSLEALIISN